jgi:nitronate monooxygenase
MGGVAGPTLAGAVARAGALGMLCEFGIEGSADRMRKALELAGEGQVGMGFFGHWIDGDLATYELAAERLRVVEVFWTTPDPALASRARRCGDALVAWQVGSRDDAVAAQDAGCDFVVAQGVEAGGHVRGTVPRDELLEQVLDAVTIPVVIAGGIASASDVASAIRAGAHAVRVGTAFVATPEGGAHPAYIDAIVAARSGAETVLTTAFGRGWPDAPHRVLASAVSAAEALDTDVVGEAGREDARTPIPRFSAVPPSRDATGNIAAMALYAGVGVGQVSSVRSATDVVSELVAGLDA